MPPNITHLKLNCDVPNLIENLPNCIEELVLDFNFDMELNNIPTSIRKIIFNRYSKYNRELNCLPNSVVFLQLPETYYKKISHLPSELKIIHYSKKYKYVKDFVDLIVINYE